MSEEDSLTVLRCHRTSFDTATKQHWLSVYRQKVLARFLLKQDSTTVPLQTTSSVLFAANAATGPGLLQEAATLTTESQIRLAVDRMIEALEEAETQKKRRSSR